MNSALFRERIRKAIKARDSYGLVFDRTARAKEIKALRIEHSDPILAITNTPANVLPSESSSALVPVGSVASTTGTSKQFVAPAAPNAAPSNVQLIPKKAPTIPKPKWHPPWKLYRVISGIECALEFIGIGFHEQSPYIFISAQVIWVGSVVLPLNQETNGLLLEPQIVSSKFGT